MLAPCPAPAPHPSRLPRLQAFQRGIEAALQQRPGADAVVLGAGGGLLALLAAQVGAASVTAVERSRMLYRMARQCLETAAAGQHAEVAARVSLLDRRLQSVGVAGEAPPPDALLAAQQRAAAGLAAQQLEAADAGALMPRRAALLVTDLLDHSVLGMGLLPALDYAAERLLAPGALVVPQRVQASVGVLEGAGGQWGVPCAGGGLLLRWELGPPAFLPCPPPPPPPSGVRLPAGAARGARQRLRPLRPQCLLVAPRGGAAGDGAHAAPPPVGPLPRALPGPAGAGGRRAGAPRSRRRRGSGWQRRGARGGARGRERGPRLPAQQRQRQRRRGGGGVGERRLAGGASHGGWPVECRGVLV